MKGSDIIDLLLAGVNQLDNQLKKKTPYMYKDQTSVISIMKINENWVHEVYETHLSLNNGPSYTSRTFPISSSGIRTKCSWRESGPECDGDTGPFVDDGDLLWRCLGVTETVPTKEYTDEILEGGGETDWSKT